MQSLEDNQIKVNYKVEPMKLTRKNLRRIILEELQQFNEEREVEAIMKRVLGEESYDDENKWHDIKAAEEERRKEKRDLETGRYEDAEHDKYHEDDLYYDAHDDKEGEDHHHHRHDGHDEGRKLDEDGNVDENWSWEEGMEDAALANAKNPELNIGESTITNKTIDNNTYLSRGALYRKRYYGRY
jgi:hypothetical protein